MKCIFLGGKKASPSEMAAAAAQLAARLANPFNAGKMLSNAAIGKGIVLPGSNYIGPGNPMDREVLSYGDFLAKKHDEAYGHYLDAGHTKTNVYGGFSEADKELMESSDLSTPEGMATYLGMKIKEYSAYLTGLGVPPLPSPSPQKSQKKPNP